MPSSKFIPNKPPINVKGDEYVFKEWFQEVWRWALRSYKVAPVQTAAFSAGEFGLYPVNTTGGSITATLPLAVDYPFKVFIFKKTVAANTMTVARSGSDTIDGAASKAFTTIWSVIEVRSDGISSWYIV